MAKHRSPSLKTPLALILVLAMPTALCGAQTIGRDEVRISSGAYIPQSGAALRASTELVEVGVVPRDLHGRAIAGLTRSDFRIFDDGKEKLISSFASARPVELTPVAGWADSPARPSALPGPSTANRTNLPGQPRAIAFLFDDIHTSSGDLGRAKIAAKRFFEYGLSRQDRIALFTSSDTVSVQFTSNVSNILSAMPQLQARLRVSENGIVPCPRITPYQAYLIANNIDPAALRAALDELGKCNLQPDTPTGPSMQSQWGLPTSARGQPNAQLAEAIETIRAQAEQTWEESIQASLQTLQTLDAVLDSLSRQAGTRLLVLVSSGFLVGDVDPQLDTLRDAVTSKALKDDVVIDAVDAKGLYSEAPGLPFGQTPNGTVSIQSLIFQSVSLGLKLFELDAPLVTFAESTGGLHFENNNDLDLGFREVGMVPAITYILGIAPARDGKYHRLRVKVRGVDDRFVQARPGYFAPSTDKGPSVQDRIDTEMLAPADKTDFPVSMSEKVSATANKQRDLTVEAYVAPHSLSFEKENGRRRQTLTFAVGLFDLKGNFVIGKEARMQMNLKQGTFERLSKTGVTGAMSLQVEPGTYRLRMVVAEGLRIQLSTVTQNVRVE